VIRVATNLIDQLLVVVLAQALACTKLTGHRTTKDVATSTSLLTRLRQVRKLGTIIPWVNVVVDLERGITCIVVRLEATLVDLVNQANQVNQVNLSNICGRVGTHDLLLGTWVLG
jgi:hypothetical protein